MTATQPPATRKSFLRQGAAAAVALAGAGRAVADANPRPLRDPDQPAARSIGLPPLPPLEVIALQRLTFGMTSLFRSIFRSLGITPLEQYDAFVNWQLNPQWIDDANCDARLAAAGFQTLNKSLTQLWADHVVNNKQGYTYRMLPFTETEKAAWIRAVYSQRQLFELLVDFWHNHFNVYGKNYDVGPVFVHYDRDVIRGNVLGNFRQMLEAVATSTAMLFYLNNASSSSGGPNENYARELFELHTLGAENYLGVGRQSDVPVDLNGVPIGYVDDDIYEATRCFTGWRVDDSTWEPGVGRTGSFLYYPSWHDRFQKYVLGKFMPSTQASTPLKDGRDVLDSLAYHPGTARFIARKLCRRLLSDTPTQSLVDQVAAVFIAAKDAPDQLKQVVRAILLAPEFRVTWGEKVRRPFEATAAVLRSLQVNFSPSSDFLWSYSRQGQSLYNYIPPTGYPDEKEDWTGTASYLMRLNFPNWLVEGWLDGVTVDVASQMPSGLRTPNQIADYWIDRLLGRPMHPAENHAEIVEFMAQGHNPDYALPLDQIAERLPRLAALILMTPDFQLR